jgi:hypothetical protein
VTVETVAVLRSGGQRCTNPKLNVGGRVDAQASMCSCVCRAVGGCPDTRGGGEREHRGPKLAVQSAPQGNWVGTYGHGGYDLAGWDGSSDASDIPGAGLSLQQGSRWVWASSTTDVRALQSADKSTREAAIYYDSNEIKLGLTFAHAYTGNLHLYALDWDKQARRETISVGGQTAALSSDFSQGAWVTFPISVAAGETVSIVVDRTAGPNAVLSGIFLG